MRHRQADTETNPSQRSTLLGGATTRDLSIPRLGCAR